MPVTAREVGIASSTLLQSGCRVLLRNDTLVSPAWAVLPMGCLWSLYFCQSVTEAIASRAPALDGLSPFHDKPRDLLLGRRQGVQAYFVSVDNLGVTAKTQQEADAALNQWTDLIAESGLILHKSELGQKVKSLGIDLDGFPLCCRVRSQRFWPLRRALDEVIRRKKIDRTCLGDYHRSYHLRDPGCPTCALYTAHVLSFRACTFSRGHSPLGRKLGPNLWQFVDF